ncbi:MAG: prolyl oligopeptidase family serine peptidase [Bryobacteraceae bacterium]
MAFTIPALLPASEPPATRAIPFTEMLHGVEISDPYRWLEDQESPETREWLKAQIAYTQSKLDALPGREAIRKRVAELMRIEEHGIPTYRGGRYFFTRRAPEQNQPAIYMREGEGRKDVLLLDPNTMSPDQSTSVSLMDVSRDGKLLVFGTRQGGEDEMVLSLLEIDNATIRPTGLPKARYYNVNIRPDKKGFYFSSPAAQGSRILYFEFGSEQGAVELFGQGYQPEQIILSELSTDGRYLIAQVLWGASADKVEVHVKDLKNDGPFVPVITGIDARFEAFPIGETLYVLTNWEAPRGRVLAIDLNNPAREHWKELVQESGHNIESLAPAAGKLFVRYLDEVQPRIVEFAPDGQRIREIPLPGLGSALGPYGDWDSPFAFFSFESFAAPKAVYRYDPATGKHRTWARTKAPVRANRFEVQQVWFQSPDRTRIPMFLVHKKGLSFDGDRPVLLYGYGGFNISVLPVFSPYAVAMAENDGIYAVANLRGGGEFGEKWHKAGMLENKQNVFDDFIAAAEWLKKSGFTNPSKLAIRGGSNGGLLVGAAMTQRPDLFQAVVCEVPLLDMLRFHKFLVARWWTPEYGSAEDPDQFEYLYRYSPYHNVRKGVDYPAVMFKTGDADTRVAPLHARKMAALMQASTGGSRPVLLHYDTKAGHTAALPVSKRISDTADVLTFILWQLGALRP